MGRSSSERTLLIIFVNSLMSGGSGSLNTYSLRVFSWSDIPGSMSFPLISVHCTLCYWSFDNLVFAIKWIILKLDFLTIFCCSKDCEDRSMKDKSRLSVSLRNLSQPMFVKDIGRTWDICTHVVISEYAQQSGRNFQLKLRLGLGRIVWVQYDQVMRLPWFTLRVLPPI